MSLLDRLKQLFAEAKAPVAQESVAPVWTLIREQESRQADRELPSDEGVAK